MHGKVSIAGLGNENGAGVFACWGPVCVAKEDESFSSGYEEHFDSLV